MCGDEVEEDRNPEDLCDSCAFSLFSDWDGEGSLEDHMYGEE